MLIIKKIAILGSTGSIGTQALEVIALHSDKFEVVALTANNNKELLFEQIKKFKPKVAALCGLKSLDEIDKSISFCEMLYGENSLESISLNVDCDYLLVAVVGMLGLKAVLAGLKSGKRILLANKEALVAGGQLVLNEVEKAEKNTSIKVENACYVDGTKLPNPLSRIIPIDSEHSALFQCMNSNSQNSIKKIFLTCSGGPFRQWDAEKIYEASKADALKHPNWNMGAKISVDSASLFNKALEIIEAKWLFNVDESDIEVLVHPQSIIHSMLGFEDGGIIAQLGIASMKLPILYSMSYPDRYYCDISYPDFTHFDFEKPNTNKFESIRLVRECIRQNDASCTVFNAANEFAVDAFLKDIIPFGEITNSVKHTLNKIEPLSAKSYEEIVYADKKARELTEQYIRRFI